MNDADWIRKRARNLGRGCLAVWVIVASVAILAAW